MLAERDVIFEEMQREIVHLKKSLLSERCVNIYSDLSDTVREGDIITMTGELVGFEAPGLSMQWQFSTGLEWIDVPGATGLSHAFVATEDTINYSWRLSVTADN